MKWFFLLGGVDPRYSKHLSLSALKPTELKTSAQVWNGKLDIIYKIYIDEKISISNDKGAVDLQ